MESWRFSLPRKRNLSPALSHYQDYYDERASSKRPFEIIPVTTSPASYPVEEALPYPCESPEGLLSTNRDNVAAFSPSTLDFCTYEANLTNAGVTISGDGHELALESPVVTGNPTPCICYGMICDIAVRFDKHHATYAYHLTKRRVAPDGKGFIVLNLSFEESRCVLLHHANFEVASLNSDTFNSLNTMQKSKLLQFEVLLSMQALEKLSENLNYIKHGKVATVNLNIYGSHEDSDAVAVELSRKFLFLQRPDCMAERAHYENPQSLQLPANVHPYNSDDIRLRVRHHDQNGEDISVALDTTDDNSLDFDKLLDRFASHDYLAQAAVDSSIQTFLLIHQREGLDFVQKREAKNSPQSRILWELVDRESPGQIFKHLITGAKSRDPQDTRGGILADDMGLGKSLMMISAIASSLASALDYARARNSSPGSTSNPVIAAKSTLLVVPSALLIENWIEEVNKHTVRNALTYFKYHGQSRNVTLIRLLDHDIIFTTYGTVAAEFKRTRSLLHQIEWYRIVLDEAHMIRNASTNHYRAVTTLSGLTRWCLTGTPIQNSLDDLGSLVTFLRVPILSESAQFRRYITRRANSAQSSSRPDFNNLRLLLGAICLRRNKAILPVAQSEDLVHPIHFSRSERQAYERLGYSWKQAIELAVGGHKTKEAHQTVLEALLRMRIYCNNGDFLEDACTSALTEPDEVGSLLQQGGKGSCYYCSCDVLTFSAVQDSISGFATACHHAVCSECFEHYEKTLRYHRKCPICNQWHILQPAKTSERTDFQHMQPRDYPPKLRTLCDDIEHHSKQSKSIVFSFWKKSLDIVETMLKERNIPHLRVDGSLPLSKRRLVLAQFQAAQQGMVLLMTLGTGAVGLNNLSVANRIHILEPQWNPSVESQAIGRVFRLGQTRTVHVIRYVVTETVEMNVKDGQLRKLQLAKGGFGAGKAESIQRKTQMLIDMVCPQSAPAQAP